MTEFIQSERKGAWGIITLTRAKALNSLTKEMCEEIGRVLEAWASDDEVRAVLVEGEGERAFCAGGDIRWLHDTGKADPAAAAQFFQSEYHTDTRIAHFPKPYVAVLDGICMGGGVGISCMASHRIATDRTVWAMPECGIGLVPDVGASYLLPRLAGGLGNYLAYTGTQLRGADCLTAEVATDFIDADKMADVRERLLALPLTGDAGGEITALLHEEGNRRPGDLVEMLETIRTYFGKVESLPALVDKLSGETEGFGAHCLDRIEKASPTSLLVTQKLLEDAPDSFDACISREFNVVSKLLTGQDFYEGVRAQVIDKDRKPKWSPAKLSEVDSAFVDAHFDVPPWGALDLSGL